MDSGYGLKVKDQRLGEYTFLPFTLPFTLFILG